METQFLRFEKKIPETTFDDRTWFSPTEFVLEVCE